MKTCEKCGIVNTDEAMFCTACGAPLAQAPVAEEAPAPIAVEPAAEPVVEPVAEPEAPAAEPVAPTAVTYEQTTDAPANEAYSYTAPAAAPAAENKATLWLILNIVLTVLCCGNILGIIGIVFSALGMSAYKKGDYNDMNQKVKTAKILFIIGIVLGVIYAIVIISTGVLSAVMKLNS